MMGPPATVRILSRMTLAAMVLAGCEPGMHPVEDIPTTLRMTLGDGTRSGCPGDGPLLEFEESLTFRLEALDTFGQPFPYTGPVGFHMSPGRLANPGLRQTMVQGSLVIPPEAALEVRLAFGGRAHVWGACRLEFYDFLAFPRIVWFCKNVNQSVKLKNI